MKTIAIDDGHGKETAGKRTPLFADGSYLRENTFNAAVARYLAEELSRVGLRPFAVAPEEEDVPLAVRVSRANQAKADLYISIHANAFGTGWNDANGVESWIETEPSEDTLRLGLAVQAALATRTKLTNRGLKRSAALYVLKQTNMPAVLVECGFMTNRKEAELLKSDAYRRLCAEAICQGICAYFGISYEEVEEVKRYESVEELPYGKETIKKLMEKGVLKGNGTTGLNLSEDMLRIFMVLDLLNLF